MAIKSKKKLVRRSSPLAPHREDAEHIVEICRRLHQRFWLSSADGNVSIRLDDERILITPTGLHKGFVEWRDMALVDREGQVLWGKPSSEKLMHLEIYRRLPLARAIVHPHPPHAIAWSVARPEWKELPIDALTELVLAVGRIPIAPYALPGTQQMGDVLFPDLESTRVMILARHGALAWGESLEEAYNGIERIEHASVILAAAHAMGGITCLPADEFARLRVLREKLGPRTL
jgi:L-fuculose-phosphate aldolase